MEAESTPQTEAVLPTLSTEPATVQSTFASFLIDEFDDWGRRRLVAVISCHSKSEQSQQLAKTIVDEVAQTFFASSLATIDQAIIRSVEIIPRESESNFGFAVGGLEGSHLVLAVSSPALAILEQDGNRVHLPTIEAFRSQGSSTSTETTLIETELASEDKVALIASQRSPNRSFDSPRSLTLEAVDSSAGADGAYVWLDVASPETVESSPLPQPVVKVVSAPLYIRDATAPLEQAWRQQSVRSSGLFQRPPGSDSLRRYRATGNRRLPDSMRSRMPRGVPPWKALTALLLLAVILISAGMVAAQRRPTSVGLQPEQLVNYAGGIASAIEADDSDLVTALMPGAETLIAQAERSDLTAVQIAPLRLQIVAANDYVDDTLRLSNPYRVGTLPAEFEEFDARIIEAAGGLYIIAGDLYILDVAARSLIPVPELSDGASGQFFNGGGDISTLVLAGRDGTIFAGDSVGGSLLVPASWPAGLDLETAHSSVYRSRLYLLDPEDGTLLIVDPETRQTSRWLSSSSDALPAEPVGMAIDGMIHVLYASGNLYSLSNGNIITTASTRLSGILRDPIGLTIGDASNRLYIADLAVPEGRVVAFDRANGTTLTMHLGPDELGRLDGSVHQAFPEMRSMLVSEDRGSVFWIAEGAIWTAQLPVDDESADQDA